MRVRAIIEGRWDWREEGPGNGSAGASGYHGSLVQGEPGAVQRHRVAKDTHRRAQPKRTLPHIDRSLAWWRTAPRCGVLMPRINQTCGRRAGHLPDHRSAEGIAAAVVKRAADGGQTVDNSGTKLGDKSLVHARRNLQNQGVKSTIPEVPTVSLQP